MDNPLYPAPSTGAAIGMLISILIWLVLLGGAGFVIYRFLRTRGYLTRMRQNLDGQAARTGYSHGLKDGEQRAQQRHELTGALEQVNELLEKVNRVGRQLEDVLRTTNRPSIQVVDRDTEKPKEDVRPAEPTGSANSGAHSASPAATGETSVDGPARRLGLRKPTAGQVEIPAGLLPRFRPTPPIPADVNTATMTTQPTPAPTSPPS